MVTNILIILYQYKMKILNNRYIELIALAKSVNVSKKTWGLLYKAAKFNTY